MCDSCETTKSAQKTDSTANNTQGGDTPEVPYQPRPRPSDTIQQSAPAPVAKKAQPAPAPDSAATPASGGSSQKIQEEEEPAPPPKHVFDATTNADFSAGV